MTIPKKDSRISNVDGVQYRWIVTRQAFDERLILLTFLAHRMTPQSPRNGDLAHVERRREPQSKLQIVFHESHCDAVTPTIAASFIRQSIRNGWDPEGPEAHFVDPHAAIELICDASV
jgi:hypothetical protein